MKDKKRRIGFIYAWNGLAAVFKTERNFRIHLIAAVLVIMAGVYFGVSPAKWGLLVLVIGLVLTAELFNTAVEKMIDYVKPDIHPAAGLIKDIAAGSVLLAALTAVAVGLIIFLPEIYAMF